MPSASDVGALPSSTVIPAASSATPKALGTAAAGTSTDYSRADHVHAKPTYSKSDVGLGNVDNVKQYSASNPPPYPVTSVNGQTGAVTVVEDDKTWGGWVLPTSHTRKGTDSYLATATSSPSGYCIAKYDGDAYLNSTTPTSSDNSTKVATTAFVKSALPAAATTTPSNLGTAAVGTSTKYAKEDHVHNYPDIVHVGSSAPADTNIELWLDNSSGGNSVVSSVDGKTGTVTVLPSGGTTGQVLKKVSGTNYDVTWANESGSVTSVNGQTGDVEISTVAVQNSAPTGGELVWIDTDESGESITIPQIDDNSVSSDDTWSSQKIEEKFTGVLPLGEVTTKIPSNANLNDYDLPGVYAIGNSSIAETITNIPQQSAGTLRVFASLGAAITESSAWKYLIQEYITYIGTRYQRYGESGSGTAVTWGAWQTIYNSSDFQSGSKYCKLPDGTLICWGNYSGGQRSTSDVGGLYSTGAFNPGITFPVKFASQPAVTITPGSGDAYAIVLVSIYSTTGITSVTLGRPNSGNLYTIFSWIAIGRWK